MPAKRPSDFETKPLKPSFEKRNKDIKDNLLSETPTQIGVVTYPEKQEPKKEKETYPCFSVEAR